MCLRLEDGYYCLTYLSLLGILQTAVAVPMIVLSFILFFSTTLGAALSPFWAGFLVSIVYIAGFLSINLKLYEIICVIII